MAKTSTNNIQNLDEDWGNDENVGLPFSGEAVQTFIKSYLKNVTAAAWFDPTNYTMYFFASQEDRDKYINDPTSVAPTFSCPMNFSSVLYRVNITNNTGTTNINVATNSGTCPISATFVVQTKSITDLSWTDTQTACYVTIMIDRGLTGIYENITERTLYPPGSTISMDVFRELAQGMNRVKIQFEAEDDSVAQALVYSINLAELYVELFNNFWYQPVMQNDGATHKFGGFKIAGAGSKTLHIAVYNSAGELEIEDISVLIGTTNAYVNTPYYYLIPPSSEFFTLPTGIYKLRVYVSTPGINSEAIEYNIMYVATADVSTAKLVCINFIADKIFNYSNAVLCKYAVYNGNATYADVEVTFQQKQGETVVREQNVPLDNILTEIEQSLGYEALWPGIEGTGYFIGFEIELAPASASGNVPLDNSTVFPPTPEYDFYMLAANRLNGEANKEKIINVANDTELAATWTGVDFANGVDGWTTDDAGRACLRIPAQSRMVLPASAFNLLSGDNQTFEIAYKVVNCADYDENVITLSPNPDAAGFRGIRIKPTNITVHNSSNSDASDDIYQGTNLCDDEVVHFVLTINPYYSGTRKLVKAYINGCKNFLFEYTNSTEWTGYNANLVIGSEKSDVFVYLIRHYPVALSDAAVQTNYINSLGDVAERDEMNYKQASVLDAGATNIDYETVKNNDYNFFVVQMTQGSGVPSAANGWGKTTKGLSILEMHFGKHPEWDWKIENPETMGQGTTSMNYYRWNIRWRIDKASGKQVPVSYSTRTKVGSSYQYTWGEPTMSKTVRFDGDNHPPLMRITAKINAASSMQSHKIGATRAYTALNKAIGLQNEAQAMAGSGPEPVVAVYEYPAFGFEYDPGTETYTYIGLFTIGPDKGDKPSFGYDKVKSTLITLEGTDHSQPLARFAYPHIVSNPEGATGDVSYYYPVEGMAINLGEGTYLTGLEISNCHNKEIDKDNKDNLAAQDQPLIRAILDEEFWPAYELIWKNSTLIFPITQSHPYYRSNAANTLAYINSHLSGETYEDNFRLGQYNDRLGYPDMQFWIEGDANYTLYYYDEADKIYKPDISLLSQNGTPSGATPDDKNEWFKEQRRARFMASAGEWFDLDDTIFHYVFCLMFGATDNFAKNSYPYKMAAVNFVNGHNTGGKWKWRQDDLDTIFDIDNSGRDSKPYMIEYEDATGTTAYFAGSNSVFWNLIHECYWEDYNNGAGKGIRTIGKNVFAAMTSLSHANNPYDGFIAFISQCFWDNAQAYFPESAYNVDCEFKYEQAWLVNGQNVPPLTQALGNHYSGERLWVRRRAVYMLSLFRTGPFGDYSDTKLGTISFRPTSLEVTLTPMMWLYPALAIGQTNIVTAERTPVNTPRQIIASVDASGNTAAYIQASNYYTTLGNLKAITLGLQDIGNITITAAKLVELIIGDPNGGVTTNIPGVVLAQNTKCLELIDFRNAASIRTISGLDNCTRLRTLLLAGTIIQQVELQAGSKIETLSLPASLTRLVLRGLKHLTTLSVAGYSNIQTVHIEDTDVDAFGILASIYAASEVLTYIRILWLGIYVDTTRAAVNMLPTLADEQYKGLAADGATVLDKPFIEGTIDVSAGGLTASNIEDLQLDIEHQEDYDGNIKKVLARVFNTSLYLLYDSTKIYISFADREVERICVENWSNDGVGLTTADAAAVTNVNGYFTGNEDITSFDEMRYFSGLTAINSTNAVGQGCFEGCINLLSISFGPNVNLVFHRAFYGCSALEEMTIQRGFSVNYVSTFDGCSSLTRINIPSIEAWLQCSFGNHTPFTISKNGHLYIDGVEVTSVTIPSSVQEIMDRAFMYCKGLTSVVIPSSVRNIHANAFNGCSALTSVTLPTSELYEIGGYAFANCTSLTGSFVIPSCVTSLGNYLFQNTGITSLTVPASVTSYLGALCYGMGSLEELHLYATLAASNSSNFYACTSLVRLYATDFEQSQSILPNQLTFANYSVYFQNNNGTHYVYFNDVEVRDLVIPNTMTRIRAGACYRWNRLTSVTIPSSVTEIGSCAFEACSDMTGSLTIPSSVTSIGSNAFLNSGITSVTIPSSVTSIGSGAFANCYGLTNVVVNGSAGIGVFQNSGARLGVLTIKGNSSGTTNGYTAFATIKIEGDFTAVSSTGHQFGRETRVGTYDFVLRIGGNASFNSSAQEIYNQDLAFFEVMGNVTNAGGTLYSNVKNGCILHLGYNGKVTSPASYFMRTASRITKIYVGPGESQAGDQAVLAQYLADSGWSAYSDKLDTWYNYNGEYKNS